MARAAHRALEQRRALGHLRERALDEVQIAAEPVNGVAKHNSVRVNEKPRPWLCEKQGVPIEES